MKTLFVSALVFLSSALAFADEMPSHWHLPNKGKNCAFKSVFIDGEITCGVRRYEQWICIEENAISSEPGTAASYLLVGTYGTDVKGICSPTYIVKSVLRQD